MSKPKAKKRVNSKIVRNTKLSSRDRDDLRSALLLAILNNNECIAAHTTNWSSVRKDGHYFKVVPPCHRQVVAYMRRQNKRFAALWKNLGSVIQ